MLRSTSRCCLRAIGLPRSPMIVLCRSSSKSTRLSNRSRKEAPTLARDAGPLFSLIKNNARNNKSPDSPGNSLHSLDDYRAENDFKKNKAAGAVLDDLKERLERHREIPNKEFFNFIHVIKRSKYTQGKLYNQFLLDLAIYMVESNKREFIDVQILEIVASFLVDPKYKKNNDFRNMINYSIMIQKLNEIRYFEELPPKLVFQIVYTPFLVVLGRDQYVLRSNNLQNSLSYVEYYQKTQPRVYKDLVKMIKPYIINSLQLSIDLDDFEKIDELWEYYYTHYDVLVNEDFHTLIHSIIQTGNHQMLEKLLLRKWNFNNSRPEMSQSDKRQIALIFLQNGEYAGFNEYFQLSKDCPIWERSAIIEQLLGSMKLYDFLKLVGEVTTPEESLVTKDFDTLVWNLHDTLCQHSRLTLVKIEESINEEILQSVELSDNVKTLYINCFLKALSIRTNITGIVHGYCQLPLELLNIESFQVLFNSFAADSTHSAKRTAELFKFAANILKLNFTVQEYSIILSNSIYPLEKSVDMGQVYYYLYQYMRRNNKEFLPARFIQLLESFEDVPKSARTLNRYKSTEELMRSMKNGMAVLILANQKEYPKTPLEAVESVVRRHGSQSLKKVEQDMYSKPVEEHYFEDYEPTEYANKNFDYYDHMDAKKLKQKHRIFIEELEEQGNDNEFYREKSTRLEKEIERNEQILEREAHIKDNTKLINDFRIPSYGDSGEMESEDLFADDK